MRTKIYFQFHDNSYTAANCGSRAQNQSVSTVSKANSGQTAQLRKPSFYKATKFLGSLIRKTSLEQDDRNVRTRTVVVTDFHHFICIQSSCVMVDALSEIILINNWVFIFSERICVLSTDGCCKLYYRLEFSHLPPPLQAMARNSR